MISILSLVTSVKDYVEIVHKLIETDSNFKISNYSELGPIITYTLISLKEFFGDTLSLNWLKNIWDLPIIIPDISSAMISEISVLDGYFHNAFNFLDKPLSYGETNPAIYTLEKFSVGLINSLFLWIPTGTSHLIILRRFLMQGLEAGYLAGLGSICGNILWIGSIVLGCRFFVIPWLSLDIFRYLLGFVLLIKYMWDSYSDGQKKVDITSSSEPWFYDSAKQKIFFLNFLLALTEQTSIYPFVSNISIGSESSALETFPAQNYLEFLSIHGFYILGLTLGSLSLLHLSCWFWENPAFKIYMWIISSFKMSTTVYYKILNFSFLYLTMICAISSIPYYGLDYTLTNPLGFVQDDRILDQKLILETSFINSKASDRNTRRNRGRHGRRERWKRRIRKYRTFDASLYDQGVYDLFTIEDLNYGFDRFWLRRKMRNHRVRFRFFPGPWMRSFKKQLAKPRLESYAGPRQEFFRILFEQVYHPSFHEYGISKIENNTKKIMGGNTSLDNKTIVSGGSQTKIPGVSILAGASTTNYVSNNLLLNNQNLFILLPKKELSIYNTTDKANKIILQDNLKLENSTLRKFVRKINTRLKKSEIQLNLMNETNRAGFSDTNKNIYSKRWKEIFSRISHDKEQLSVSNGQLKGLFRNFYETSLNETTLPMVSNFSQEGKIKKENSKIILSRQDKQVLKYRSMLAKSKNSNVIEVGGKVSTSKDNPIQKASTLLHPLQFYLKKQEAFERKLRYYTPTIFRKFSIENNAPYFRIMMKRYFYYFKPTLRWERTMKVASLRKARRKTSVSPRKIQFSSFNTITDVKTDVNKIPLIKNDNLGFKNSSAPVFPGGALTPRSGSGEGYAPYRKGAKQPARETSVSTFNEEFKKSRQTKPTHNYTIVGKRASRFRYEIYKDVLQHWYYSPFNRLLLKLDIDLFIKRQPNSHFLTKNEEKLLHLRRFLLSEHYNTLRWYSYMQHYRSMKTKIGGTKSFASKVYNQQFSGTFKKIRHLFAITPSQSNQSILKFDQPLYNESFNNSKNNLQLIIHEELLSNAKTESGAPISLKSNILGKDLVNQSTEIIGTYLQNSNTIKQRYIKDLIENKNYFKLTEFLYKGQKTRGLKAITNNSKLINQEKEYLLTNSQKIEFKNLEKIKINKILRPLQQDLWINLLKNWKRKINDQEFLKNYLQRRIEKREKRKQKKERNLKLKFERLENWLAVNQKGKNQNFTANIGGIIKKETTTTGINNALIDGVLTLKNTKSTTNKEERLNLVSKINSQKELKLGDTNLSLKNNSFIQKEKELNNSIKTLSTVIKDLKNSNLKNSSNYNTNNIDSNITKKIAIFKKIKNLSKIYILYSTKFIVSSTNKFLKIFKPIVLFEKRKKSFKNWQKVERSLNKQKRSRKEFKLFTKKPFQNNSNSLALFPQKSDLPLNSDSITIERKKRDFSKIKTVTNSEIFPGVSEATRNGENDYKINQNNWKDIIKQTYKKHLKTYFTQHSKFKRKKSPQRRARIRRNRGVNKKRTLSDSLKREFKNLRKYGEKMDSDLSKSATFSKKQKIYLSFQNIAQGNENNISEISVDGTFKQSPLQRRSKQKKQRFWKQKRSKYSQKLRKYKKRRRSILSKVRILNKQLKRIQSTNQLKNWWWQNFLPNLRATTDSLLQFEKDRQIQQKLSELSISEILEKDLQLKESVDSRKIGNQKLDSLQIGDYDFKPLSMPEALRLREKNIILNKQSFNLLNQQDLSNNTFFQDTKNNILGDLASPGDKKEKEYLNQAATDDIVSQLSKSSLLKDTKSLPIFSEKQPIFNSNILPFYAGWDESLRKFVVTNRLLSRRSSGYEIEKTLLNSNQFSLAGSKNQKTDFTNDNFISFSDAPLKGMNAATTLYWQIPFTTYDPDQFFALGMDGFAPLGWRRFQFRHSILKSWLQDRKNSDTKIIDLKNNNSKSFLESKINQNFNKNTFITKNKTNILDRIYGSNFKTVLNISDNPIKLSKTSTKKANIYRRLKKRYKRVKKHPRSPVWFPSGPLLNQVLPVHYIYIFYKRSRLPRDRYLKRRLRKSKTISYAKNSTLNSVSQEMNKQNLITPNLVAKDFSLRKRVKTKRKYHVKQDFNKNQSGILIPRRMKFIGDDSSSMRWRPLSRQKINKPIAELIKEQRALKYKQRKKDEAASSSNNKQPSNLRVKQLRRRVQRQIIRSVWRYRPRAGGFVWPGDYLKLEQVKAPKLKIDPIQTNLNSDLKSSLSKIKRKKKRNIQEWQIQPKKYLLEKHNLNAIKKKLEKAHRSNKIKERIKDLNLTL